MLGCLNLSYLRYLCIGPHVVSYAWHSFQQALRGLAGSYVEGWHPLLQVCIFLGFQGMGFDNLISCIFCVNLVSIFLDFTVQVSRFRDKAKAVMLTTAPVGVPPSLSYARTKSPLLIRPCLQSGIRNILRQ